MKMTRRKNLPPLPGNWLHPYVTVLAEKDILSIELGNRLANILIEWGVKWVQNLRESKNSSILITEQESLIPVTMRTVSVIVHERRYGDELTTPEVSELIQSLLDLWKRLTDEKITDEKMRHAAVIIRDFYHCSTEELFNQLLSLIDQNPNDKTIALQ